MNIRIYQINMERDLNRVAFCSHDQLEKYQGSSEIDSKIYDKVYEGAVEASGLEDVYRVFNLEHPSEYRGRSLSVSDIVEVIGGGDEVIVGQPTIEGAKVEATVIGEIKGPKVVIRWFRRRKNSRRKNGHRQKYTYVEIKEINF